MEKASFGFMVPKVPNKHEASKGHATSTPYNDKQSAQITTSMHEYLLNGSEINSSKNVPILGNNVNIHNVSNSDTVNYQAMRKLASDVAENTEKLIREKENMLQHLKSIDLSKYSFPNESSYLKECKNLANDNVEMPNLCRRARRSPQNSLNQNSPNKSKSFLNKSSDEKSIDQSLLMNTPDPRLDKSSVIESSVHVSRKIGKKCFSFRKLCLFFILLIPICLYGFNKLDKKEKILENINENYLDKYLYLKVEQDKIDLYRNQIDYLSDQIEYFFTNYIPELFFMLKKKTNVITDSIIEYKDATFGGFDLARNFLKKEDLIQSLEDIKKNFLQKTLAVSKDTSKKDDLLIREDFDKIFNYTLSIMTNKLADQLVESKQNYETELKQVKQTLSDLDSRYQNLLSQFQEQKLFGHKSIEDIISFQKIEEYINKSFYLYNADKTGMPDFASESAGGSILFTRCTEDYLDNSRWITVLNVPITRLSVSPRVVIQGSMQPGNCWAFKGSKADLFIKLAARITPSSFSIEHIPKELSLTGVIDSAPQNFSVYGYESKDLINDEVRLLLGNYRYDNQSQNTLQFFSVKNHHQKPISVVELKIESNAGNKEFTCLYKFRVHGKLFKLVKNQNDKLPVESEKKNEL